MREFIQAMVEGELDAALMRLRYGRRSQSSNSDADRPVGAPGSTARTADDGVEEQDTAGPISAARWPPMR